jgi:hypothetical protein
MPPPSSRRLSEHDLLRAELPESRYKIDLTLFEQSQNLSAELLKLSLAAIAVVGALLSVPTRPWPDDLAFKLLISASVVVFAFSAGLALLQRFFSSSAMFHHIKALKAAHANDPALTESVEMELAVRQTEFARAHRLLVGTAIFLGTGAVCLGVAFVRLLFVP